MAKMETSKPIKEIIQNTIPDQKNYLLPRVEVPQRREVTDVEIADNEARRKRRGYAPNPLCDVCGGVGFVHPLGSMGKPIYGQIIECTAPSCLVEARDAWKQSGNYLELKGVTVRMQTFEQFKERNGSQKALNAFKLLATGQTDKPFLLCYGGNGNGKTHLCQALTTVLNQRGIDTHFYRVPDLIRILRTSIESHSTDEWLKALSEMAGLVLDDYGLEHETDWTASSLEDIIDVRWQNKRITVVATNKDPNQLTPRIRSRMCDTELSTVVFNESTDYRRIIR